MIALLLVLHPRRWRVRYGEEFRALLEATPMDAGVVLDVLRNAARLHARAHAMALRIVTALAQTSLAEVLAVRANLTDNILWAPTTPLRALALAAVVLPWVPVVAAHLPALAHRDRPTGTAAS